MIPWTKKYIPTTAAQMRGQNVDRLRSFVNSFPGRKRALLLYGPTGCGKTSSVYAVARDLDFEVLEVNASDVRNAAAITSIIGAASGQRSLFSKGKIILIDEVDGVSGQKDRGGVAALVKLSATSKSPIVLTANDPSDKKFSSLRKVAEIVEFRPLAANIVADVIKEVCKKERIAVDIDALQALANRSGGDMRAAITDLQILTERTKVLDKKAVDTLSDRERTEQVESALRRIFSTTQFEVALSALDDLDETPDEWFLWVDQNVPAEYSDAKVIERAYDAISKADVHKGRISRSQYWRLLVYIKFYLSVGVALAKDEKSSSAASYKRSSRPLKIWMANARFLKRKNIAEKLAAATHTSSKYAINESLPHLLPLLSSSKDVVEELELDADEIAWIKKAV